MATLAETTPWAEVYTGSGRLTGGLVERPTYTASGDVTPQWRYVGEMTEDEFNERFEREQHNAFHSPSNPDWSCPLCEDWIQPNE